MHHHFSPAQTSTDTQRLHQCQLENRLGAASSRESLILTNIFQEHDFINVLFQLLGKGAYAKGIILKLQKEESQLSRRWW